MENDSLTETIIKACYEVHNELGTGYNEKVYENALLIALDELGLKAAAQVPLAVHFRERVVGEYFAAYMDDIDLDA